MEHTHQCRDCRSEIYCSEDPCTWEGGNSGCEYCAPVRTEQASASVMNATTIAVSVTGRAAFLMTTDDARAFMHTIGRVLEACARESSR